MTKPNDNVVRETNIVVASDICSSTAILEDLLRSESQARWRNLLIGLKEFLLRAADQLPLVPYKFVGDGWILLFDTDIRPRALFRFLEQYCKRYDELFSEIIEPVLSCRPGPTGIAFGIDRGTLVQFVMSESNEFIGRPLNVASRLQAAVKQTIQPAAWHALITNSLYADQNHE